MRTGREVAVFVHRAGRFLVMRRAAEDYWHVVAGSLEPGESAADAAQRELREETGLESPEPLVDLGLAQEFLPATLEERALYPADTVRVIVDNFLVEAPASWEPTLNEEHVEHRWCALDDALALLHWPETREAIVVVAGRRAR